MSVNFGRLVKELDHSQWLSSEEIAREQRARLRVLLTHLMRQSPFLRQRILETGMSIETLCSSAANISKLPIITRRDLQLAHEDFFAGDVPQEHQPVASNQSSGSTGEPVKVRRTALNYAFWHATTIRDHLWHRRDASGTLAAVRANLDRPAMSKSWGGPVGAFFQTGPSYGIPGNTDIGELLVLLLQARPDYLLIYPSIWRALLDRLQASGVRLESLRQIRTVGETVTDDLRVRTRDEAGVDLVDIYSAEEVGTIAIQCPHSGLYHTMAEGLWVEVLAPDGSPCRTGEIGRVVITDLLNYASPIVRYENGDYAEVGPACGCGRGLPTLTRIVGRERNMLRLPDGRSYWPTTGYREFSKVARIWQYQLVQKDLRTLEVRLVVAERTLTPDQERQLSEIITRWIGHPFDLRFVYFEHQIPRHRSGKFEEFICEI